jgi:broad specificity phosphatase PhoE
MRKLIVVRHSNSKVALDLPANQWALSELGRQRVHLLADHVRPYYPDIVISSSEIKAMETGQILAKTLGAAFETADGLHEHDRTNVSTFDTVEQFEEQVEMFFNTPSRRVFGLESADEARIRFRRALNAVLDRYSSQTVAVVSHGTVLSLFLTDLLQIPAFPFWKRLGQPAFAVLDLPDMKVSELVESIDSAPV